MKIFRIPIETVLSNCYLLVDEDTSDCAVIDPGGEPEKVMGFIEKHDLRPQCVLLTHGHYDHTGGVGAFLERWPDLPVCIHPLELSKKDRFYHFLPPVSCAVKEIHENDHIQVGGLEVTVLETPGHTEGGISFCAEGILFTGDTLLAGTVGRTDLPGGSEVRLVESLKRLEHLERDIQIYPGHGEPTCMAAERANNPALWTLLLQSKREIFE